MRKVKNKVEMTRCPKHGIEILPSAFGSDSTCYCPQCASEHPRDQSQWFHNFSPSIDINNNAGRVGIDKIKPTDKQIAIVKRTFEKLHKLLVSFVLEKDLSNLRIAYGDSMVKYEEGYPLGVDE